MSQARLTLDNQVFTGTLRYKRRSVAYVPRPVQTRTIQDIAAVRRQPSHPKISFQNTGKKLVSRQYMDVKPKHMRPHSAQSAATIQPRQDVSVAKSTKTKRRRKTKSAVP
ncbi:hypothetical protein IPL68_01695 [Candidatus Saccharibacteria bacterium]|nr:MAG: hypothetical protein IPL68_01695 [Candidatus Saccharibacteria bacterium]